MSTDADIWRYNACKKIAQLTRIVFRYHTEANDRRDNMTRLRKKHETEVDDLFQDMQAQFEEAKTLMETQVNQSAEVIRKEYEDQIIVLRNENEIEKARAAKFTQSVQKSLSQYESTIRELEDHVKRITCSIPTDIGTDIQAKFDAQMAAMTTSFQTKLVNSQKQFEDEKHKLVETIHGLQISLDNEREKSKQLQSQLHSATAESKRRQDESSEIDKAKNDVEKEKKDAVKRIQSLKAQNDQLQNQIKLLSDDNDRLKRVVDANTKKCNNLTAEIQNLENERRLADKQTNDLRETIDRLNLHSADLETTISSLRAQIEQLNQDLAISQQKRNSDHSIINENIQLATHVKTLQNEIDDLKYQLTISRSAESIKDRLEKELHEMTQARDNLDIEVQNLSQKVRDLEAETAQSRTAHDAECKTLQNTIYSQATDIATLRASLEKMRQRISQLEQTPVSTDDSAKKIKDLEQQIVNIRDQAEIYRRRLKKNEREHERLLEDANHELERRLHRIRELENSVCDESRVRELESLVEEKVETIGQLMQELRVKTADQPRRITPTVPLIRHQKSGPDVRKRPTTGAHNDHDEPVIARPPTVRRQKVTNRQ